MTIVLIITIFAALYAIKGGWHWRIKFLTVIKDKLPFIKWFVDGTQLSSFLAAVTVGLYTDPIAGALFGLAWWLGVMPSMGEEAGAVGRWGHAWGQYIRSIDPKDGKPAFDRSYGIKKAIQRGVFLGALLTLVTGYTPFIIAGATFPIAYFIGTSFAYYVLKQDGWAPAEPLYGAFLGIAAAYYMGA